MPTSPANLDPRNNVDTFVQSLLRRFDTNGDKQLDVNEFSSLLSRVLGDVSAPRDITGRSAAALREGSVSEMTGFDAGKMNTASTVKYKFARVARNFDLGHVNDKPSAEALLRRMTPELQQAGLSVLEVSTDKIKIRHDDGTHGWIDVIRGTGGPNQAWQWLDENG